MDRTSLRRPLWSVARRLAWAGAVLWLGVTAIWVLFLVAPDGNRALIRYAAAMRGGDAAAMIDAYEAARGFDRPLYVRYLDWLASVFTLQFGQSFLSGTPVTTLLRQRGATTLMYVLPGLTLSTLVATAAGLFAGTNPRSALDRVGQLVSGLGFGVPSFWLAVVGVSLAVSELGFLATDFDFHRSVFAAQNLVRFVMPAVVVALGVGAVQFRYVRGEAIDHLHEDFVKLVKAKGGGRVTVVRHVFRNAVVPIAALFFTEVLTVLLLTTYAVEEVFGIEGVGSLTLRAVRRRDLAVLFGIVFCLLCIVVAGRTLTGLLRARLYPDE